MSQGAVGQGSALGIHVGVYLLLGGVLWGAEQLPSCDLLKVSPGHTGLSFPPLQDTRGAGGGSGMSLLQ